MYIKTISYLILIVIVLMHPTQTFHYAYQGLYQWATRMVPTLFPFMMISSIMIYSGADTELGHMLTIPFKKIYKYNKYGKYAIFMGFLCGFPMGAKIVSELYDSGKIDKEEAHSLLGFCNNIGPAYFLGIIFPILDELNYKNKIPFLLGMYGIPAIYGIYLSNIYNKRNKNNLPVIDKENKNSTNNACYSKIFSNSNYTFKHFPAILKKACLDNTQSIILLGGYITFINAFRIFIDFIPFSTDAKAILSSFLEIMGGVQTIYTSSLLPDFKVFWIMTALCFSGISCFLQTSCFLEKTGLSTLEYIKHKLIITFISATYYLIIIYLI